MKSIFTFLIFSFISISLFGQEANLNKYKYVIVNDQFEFVRKVDGYQTSSLTQFLFNKKGFSSYIENQEMPEDLMNNRCKALFVDVKDDSGLLRTKLYIELKDCNGQLLYTSPRGSSKLKSYEKAYRVAIRQAFESIQKIPYVYTETPIEKKKIISKPVVKKEQEKKKIEKKPVIVTTKVKTKYTEKKDSPISKDIERLYAQETPNGYQLVNTKPEVVFVLLITSDPDKFIIKDKNGTLVKEGDIWKAEYYESGKLLTKKYKVKF